MLLHVTHNPGEKASWETEPKVFWMSLQCWCKGKYPVSKSEAQLKWNQIQKQISWGYRVLRKGSQIHTIKRNRKSFDRTVTIINTSETVKLAPRFSVARTNFYICIRGKKWNALIFSLPTITFLDYITNLFLISTYLKIDPSSFLKHLP